MILLKLWLLLTALLKAFGAHETLLICYQSKFAKDIGNLKAGGRFKVKNSVNKGFAYECAGNDGTKGWHAVRISNDNTGIVTLDASFSNKPLIVNASKYAKINITKALTSYGQAVGVDFLKAIHFGAFMIDFDCMQFQIAALEIRQFIGKKDPKLCKTKCSAKWALPTETPKDFLTVKLSTTQISTATTTTPVMPKAHHLNHLGINCMQIEFPMGTPSFSLNISASAYVLACEEYEKQYTDYPKTLMKRWHFLIVPMLAPKCRLQNALNLSRRLFVTEAKANRQTTAIRSSQNVKGILARHQMWREFEFKFAFTVKPWNKFW
uniref:Fibrinogen C-terminal domain-containing protein n=1 Tax=Globodera pallida TaxID=36090 RepID=A0A183CG10_GLOPA